MPQSTDESFHPSGLLPQAPPQPPTYVVVGGLLLCAVFSASVVSCKARTKKKTDKRQTPSLSHSDTQPATTADQFLRSESLHSLQIKLSEGALESLGAKPRRYVEGQLVYAGVDHPVSLKLKGNRSFRDLDGKPAIKLRFNRENPKGRFLGLKRLTLNNMVDDPTRMRESIGYRVYHAAGLAAPRTAYATLKINEREMGIYLAVEAIDDVFVSSRFGKPIGGLYEAEDGCDFYPADVENFEREEGPAESRLNLARVANAVASESPELWIENSPYIDRDAVISYLAVSTLLGDFDGYWHSHNYFLYEKGPGGPWLILPWGIDRVFNDVVDIFASRGRLAEVCFANSDCTLAYAKRLLELTHLMDRMQLVAEMRDIFAALGNDAFVDQDPNDNTSQEERQRKRRRMRDFIRDRPAAIRASLSCLDGQTEVDPDGDGFACRDCDNNNPAIFPGAVETCDEIDNDCNGLVDDSAECPCDILTIDEESYHLCHWRMDWWEAQKFCESKGLALARFDNAAHSEQVLKAGLEIDDNLWWIGATDRDSEGDWRWSNGAKMDWSNWDHGQPDDNQCGQDCAALSDIGDGRWLNAHCEQALPFVCR